MKKKVVCRSKRKFVSRSSDCLKNSRPWRGILGVVWQWGKVYRFSEHYHIVVHLLSIACAQLVTVVTINLTQLFRLNRKRLGDSTKISRLNLTQFLTVLDTVLDTSTSRLSTQNSVQVFQVSTQIPPTQFETLLAPSDSRLSTQTRFKFVQSVQIGSLTRRLHQALPGNTVAAARRLHLLLALICIEFHFSV